MIHELGSTRDRKLRRSNANVRVDDEARQRKVENARDIIYDQGFPVNSTHVEGFLKGESLVPTKVCSLCPTRL